MKTGAQLTFLLFMGPQLSEMVPLAFPALVSQLWKLPGRCAEVSLRVIPDPVQVTVVSTP